MTPPQQNPNVASQQNIMAQVKRERQPAERVTIEDIVSAMGEDYGIDPMTLQAALAKAQNENPKFRIFRYGNTLFLTLRTAPDTMEVMLETLDDPKDLVAAIQQAVKAAKVLNVKKLIGDVTNPAILKMYQAAGLKYNIMPPKGVIPGTNQPLHQIMVEVS
jgi:hypothetical protein